MRLGFLESRKPEVGPESPLAELKAPYQPNLKAEHLFDGQFYGADLVGYSADTRLSEIPAIKSATRAVEDRLIYINGINTDIARHHEDMKALADTGAEVIGLHNGTVGLPKDLIQHWSLRRGSPAIRSEEAATKLIVNAVLCGEALHLLGHSQGAFIISRALNFAKRELESTHQATPDEIGNALQKIRIETHGGVSREWLEGPQYLHYINKLDPICRALGVTRGTKGQPRSDVFVFSKRVLPGDLPPMTSQRLSQVHDARLYFDERVPFGKGLEIARSAIGA